MRARGRQSHYRMAAFGYRVAMPLSAARLLVPIRDDRRTCHPGSLAFILFSDSQYPARLIGRSDAAAQFLCDADHARHQRRVPFAEHSTLVKDVIFQADTYIAAEDKRRCC